MLFEIRSGKINSEKIKNKALGLLGCIMYTNSLAKVTEVGWLTRVKVIQVSYKL
jgi:hypothetical protein